MRYTTEPVIRAVEQFWSSTRNLGPAFWAGLKLLQFWASFGPDQNCEKQKIRGAAGAGTSLHTRKK